MICVIDDTSSYCDEKDEDIKPNFCSKGARRCFWELPQLLPKYLGSFYHCFCGHKWVQKQSVREKEKNLNGIVFIKKVDHVEGLDFRNLIIHFAGKYIF